MLHRQLSQMEQEEVDNLFDESVSTIISAHSPRVIQGLPGLDEQTEQLFHDKVVCLYDCQQVGGTDRTHLLVIGNVQQMDREIVESSYQSIEGNENADVTFVPQYGLHELSADHFEYPSHQPKGQLCKKYYFKISRITLQKSSSQINRGSFVNSLRIRSR